MALILFQTDKRQESRIMNAKILFALLVCLCVFTGCQSPGRIAIKATPSKVFVDKFDYTVEFLLDDERIR